MHLGAHCLVGYGKVEGIVGSWDRGSWIVGGGRKFAQVREGVELSIRCGQSVSQSSQKVSDSLSWT